MGRLVVRLALFVMVVGLAAVTSVASAGDRVVAAQTGAPREAAEAAETDCTNSPFGRLLTIGAENEVFVGYRGGAGSGIPNGLANQRLDFAAGQIGPGTAAPVSGAEVDGRFLPSSGVTGTAVDLNGDGRFEYVQAAKDRDNNYGLLVTRNSRSTSDVWGGNQPAFTNNSGFSLTSGYLKRNKNRGQQLAAASRNSAGALSVNVWGGTADGGIGEADNAVQGYFRSSAGDRANAATTDIAAADLDGDGYDDELIVALLGRYTNSIELVVLQYRPGYSVGEGDPNNSALNWQEIESYAFQAGEMRDMHLAAGDIDGDYKDEAVLTYGNTSPDTSYNTHLRLHTFNFTNQGGFSQKSYRPGGDAESANQDLALALGDTDRDGKEEIVLAYRDLSNPNNSDRLAVRTFDAEQDVIFPHNSWFSSANSRFSVSDLDVASGDLNKDGLAEIVPVFEDGQGWTQVVLLRDRLQRLGGLTETDFWRDGDHGRTNAGDISVSMGDWGNNSIKASYKAVGGILCKRVVEPQVTAAVFVPPYWDKIQGSQYVYGTLGRSESREETTESAYTTEHSHSVSGYVGGGIDAEVVEASVRVTGGYEWNASQTRSDSFNEGTTNREGFLSSSGDYVVIDRSASDCYSYQMLQGSNPIDGNMHYCASKYTNQTAAALDTWDTQFGPVNQPDTLQWTPIYRDWASLALFRGPNTAQSSNAAAASGSSRLAVDSNTDGSFANGSVSLTGRHSAPNTAWWQVDLGSTQDITKLAIWNRTGNDCGGRPCAPLLKNFYVFASNTDFRNISGDPGVLKADPRVETYYHAGTADRVTNLQTLDNSLQALKGRYVRIQLAGAGSLALSEVHVLGSNQVDPDRYPVQVSDPDSTVVNGEITPGKDGWFLVRVYNPYAKRYEWVRTRGNLLWNGANYSVLNNKTIGPGGVMTEWGLSQNSLTSTTEATSIGNAWRAGAEFDFRAGVFSKVEFGGSYEFSEAITEENSTTLSWGEGLDMAGGATGFPTGVTWPSQCEYKYQPYYYEMSQPTSHGYEHRFTVVDYVSPDTNGGLDRAEDMQPCRDGVSWTTSEVALDPASVNFGSVRVGRTSTTKTVTLANRTLGRIGIGSIRIAGKHPADFVESTTCGSTLASGASCDIAVRFGPKATGLRSAKLSVLTDRSSTPEITTLTGTGT